MRTMLLAVLAVTLVSCQREMAPHTRSAEEQVIRDRLAQWARLMNNRSVDSLGAYYVQTPQFTAAWPDGDRQRGWEAGQDGLRRVFGGLLSLNLVVQDPEVRVIDEHAAVATFRFSMDELLRDATRDVFAGQATQVWTREGSQGDWRIEAQQLSRNSAGQTAQPLHR